MPYFGPFCHRVLVPDAFCTEIVNLIFDGFLSMFGMKFWGTSWNDPGH